MNIFYGMTNFCSIAQPQVLSWMHCSLVIMSLVDLAHGKQRHIPYRDSRLTFFLQVTTLTHHVKFQYIWIPLISEIILFHLRYAGFTWRELENYDNCKCQPFSMVMILMSGIITNVCELVKYCDISFLCVHTVLLMKHLVPWSLLSVQGSFRTMLVYSISVCLSSKTYLVTNHKQFFPIQILRRLLMKTLQEMC